MSREGIESGVAAEEHVEEARPKRRQAVIADISKSADDMARDAAESRRSKEKAELGNVSFLRRVKRRIWDFNLADSFYRQRAVVQAREGISENESLYGQDDVDREAHKETVKSVVERFTSEYESKTIHHDVGEEKKVLGDEAYDDRQATRVVKALVEDYAVGRIDEDSFREARGRALAAIYDLQPDAFERGSMYADNLLEIAREARRSVEHYGALREIDLDFEVIVGRAKAGVRTEAQYNTLDRIIDRLQSSKMGSAAVDLFGEKTVALGLSAAYTFIGGVSRRVASSRALAVATFFGTAGISSAIVGARKNKELKDQRRQHAREIAQGRTFNPNAAPFRKEMEEFRYETRKAEDLSGGLNGNLQGLYHKTEGGTIELRDDVTAETYEAALASLAEINARIEVSDRHKIDLISHSSLEKVSIEQKDLDILRAKAETDLVNVHQQLQDRSIITSGQSFSNMLQTITDGRISAFTEGDQGMKEKDRLFNKMKRKQVGLTMGKAFLIGATIGAGVQEAAAFARGGQEGLIESWIKGKGSYQGYIDPNTGKTVYNYSGLQGLRRWISGGWPEGSPGAPGSTIAGRQDITLDGLHASVPKDCTVIPAKEDGSFVIMNIKDNTVLYDNVRLDANGKLPDAVQRDLPGKGFIANSWMETVAGEKGSVQTGIKEYLGKHPDKTIRVRRSWYDNDTPKPIFDKNELKLLWGGIKGAGVDKDGNYVLNIKQMMPDGSYHGKLSVNAQELMKSGKAMLAISASQDTQGKVFTLHFDADGNVRIPPGSEIGRMFFEADDKGRAVFKGRFAEVAHFADQQTKDGREIMRVLATHTGKGIDAVTDEIEGSAKNIPKLCLEEIPKGPGPVPPDGIQEPVFEIEPPWFIPIAGRRRLEPTEQRNGYPETVYSLYPRVPEEEREDLLRDMSPRLRANPDTQLNPQEEIAWYFEDQERRHPGHRAELDRLNSQVREPIGSNTKAVVALAVAGHQEHANIYRTLETYAIQRTRGSNESVWKGNSSKYEIILYVNWPQGKEAKRTLAEIRRFQRRYPDVPVRVYTEQITNGKVEVGLYKKKAFDLALQRHQARGVGNDILIIANDADMVYTSPTYLEDVCAIMDNPKNEQYDALLGRQDLHPEVYERNPTFHAAMRFWQFMEAAVRAKQGVIGTQGRNTVLRGSSYAAIGGNRTKDFWADVEFGKLLAVARPGKHNIGYSNSAWVMVDPRREIDKFKNGELIATTWSDFNEREGVRGTANREHQLPERLNVAQLVRAAESSGVVTQFRESLQDEIRAIIYAFGPKINVPSSYSPTGGPAGAELPEGIRIIQKAAEYVGIVLNFQVTEQGLETTITDTTKLRQRLLQYRRGHRKETKIKRNPLFRPDKRK